MQLEIPWDEVTRALSEEGCAILPGGLAGQALQTWANALLPARGQLLLTTQNDGPLDRRGLAETELPAALRDLRDTLYERLVPLANTWNEQRAESVRFPPNWHEFHAQNLQAGQLRSLSCVERVVADGFTPLRQDGEGVLVFPVQLITLVSHPREFTGGELVLTEQRPRMQSRPTVISLGVGDVALIATSKRPVQGSQGFYTVNTRHAVSRVHRGERVSVTLSFHDGP